MKMIMVLMMINIVLMMINIVLMMINMVLMVYFVAEAGGEARSVDQEERKAGADQGQC